MTDLPIDYQDSTTPTGALTELPATTSRGMNAITAQINANRAGVANSMQVVTGPAGAPLTQAQANAVNRPSAPAVYFVCAYGVTVPVATTADLVFNADSAAPSFGTATAATRQSTSSTSVAVAVPTSVAVGDLVVAFLAVTTGANSQVTVTGPTGAGTWVQAASSPVWISAVYWQLVVMYKVATAADTGTYTFTTSAAVADTLTGAARFTGVSATPFDDTDSAAASAAGAATPSVAVTTTGVNRLLLFFAFGSSGGGTNALPANFSTVFNFADWWNMEAGYKVQAVAGSSGSITATLGSATGTNGAWLGAITPA